MSATLSAVENISFSKEVETLFSEEFSIDEPQMVHEHQQSEADMCAVMSDTLWTSLYPSLRSLACYLVCTSPLPYWRGKEDDMVEDIVQETIRRVIERAHKAVRGEASPILSFKQMATTIAYNYYRDLKRHDYRLSRLDATDAGTHSAHWYPVDAHSDEYLLDIAAEKVDQDRLFDILAGEIGRFPPKQRQAILMDLANRMYFDAEPTSLQQSFLHVGIELRQYCQPLPDDCRERSRYISLCSQAYKRIASRHRSYNAAYDSKEQTNAFVTDHTSTSDTKERIETNMMPSVQSPSQCIQTEDIGDTPTEINTNEDVVTQSPNTTLWISTLPEPYKTSLHMRIIEKKTYQEIAHSMRLPLGTVKSHICRGMKLLRKRMDTNEVDEQTIKRDPEEALLSIEHALVHKQIPQPYRKVLYLHYLEKQTYATIASSLQIPIGTVKSYINRGKKFLSSITGGN